MANIITQLRSGKADVHHRGYDLKDVEMPEYIKEIASVAFDEEALIETAKDHGVLTRLVHLGLSEWMVKWRANVRPSDTNEKPKDILDEEDEARERGRTFKPGLLPNPDEVKTSKAASKIVAEVHRKMAIGLAQTGMDWSTAKTVLINGGATELEELESIFTRALED